MQRFYLSCIRAHEHVAFSVADILEAHTTVLMLRTIVTTLSHFKILDTGMGRKAIIICLSDLGRFGIFWSVTFNTETTTNSYTDNKREDALKLHVKDCVVTNEKSESADGSSTPSSSSTPPMPWTN